MTSVQTSFAEVTKIIQKFELPNDKINIQQCIQDLEIPDFKFDILEQNQQVTDNAIAAKIDCEYINKYIIKVKSEVQQLNQGNQNMRQSLQTNDKYFQFISENRDKDNDVNVNTRELHEEFKKYLWSCLHQVEQEKIEQIEDFCKYIAKIVRATYKLLLSKDAADYADAVHYSESLIEQDKNEANDDYKKALSIKFADEWGPDLNYDEINEFIEEYDEQLKELIAEDEELETPDGKQTLQGISNPDDYEQELELNIEYEKTDLLDFLEDVESVWGVIVRVIIVMFTAGGGYEFNSIGSSTESENNKTIILLGPFNRAFGEECGEAFEWYVDNS